MTITDQPLNLDQVSIAEVALSFPQSLDILKAHDLDYCCGGKRSFRDACRKAGADPESIWRELLQARANSGADNRMRFDTWDVNLLINFIVQHHHEYVRSAIPQIKQLLDKVCKVHGEDSPYLYAIQEHFSDLSEELLGHLPKEEEVLFPLIRSQFAADDAAVMSPAGPIQVMEHEHEEAGALIKSIRSLSDNYTPPDFACPTFRMTYVMLEQFDNDLMQHIHLENNILFPRAMQKMYSI